MCKIFLQQKWHFMAHFMMSSINLCKECFLKNIINLWHWIKDLIWFSKFNGSMNHTIPFPTAQSTVRGWGGKLANLVNWEPFANLLFSNYFCFRNTGEYVLNFEINKMAGFLGIAKSFQVHTEERQVRYQ